MLKTIKFEHVVAHENKYQNHPVTHTLVSESDENAKCSCGYTHPTNGVEIRYDLCVCKNCKSVHGLLWDAYKERLISTDKLSCPY